LSDVKTVNFTVNGVVTVLREILNDCDEFLKVNEAKVDEKKQEGKS